MPLLPNTGLPSPPSDDAKPVIARRSVASKIKTNQRTPKGSSSSSRSNSGSSTSSGRTNSVHHEHSMATVGADGRHKRVWKACERCRMKKTKCDGEFPCKRCKDDGLVCAAGVRKKMEYKQLPKGYAEVLENTQFALVATVQKLYTMIRNGQQWDLGEPELNDHGEPVIHNIAQMLGCIRPNSDIDLPVHSTFPQDQAGMTRLAQLLQEQQHADASKMSQESLSHGSPVFHHTSRASSSELDYSDFEMSNYRKTAFGSHASSNSLTMSPQSLTGSLDFSYNTPPANEISSNVAAEFSYVNTSMLASYSNWIMSKQQDQLAMQMVKQQHALLQDPPDNFETAGFGIIRPDVPSASANPALVMGMGDPTIYAGYEDDAMNL